MNAPRVISPKFAAWLEQLQAAIPSHLRQRPWVVALSGGLDSTLLLHGLWHVQQQGELGALRAVHVHHGLLAEADAWVEHVQAQCNALAVPLHVQRIRVETTRGQGVEAAARESRYAALLGSLQSGDVLVTAHHQDDQAETFVLQLMRGAGVRGLAAMPKLAPLALSDGTAWHLRPLLAMTRAQLAAVATECGLQWVDDPSNVDTAFRRNHVRHALMPVLRQQWPQASATLARCAERMASTEALLHDLARIDLYAARMADDPWVLRLDALRALSMPRLHNALRAWLVELGLPTPPAARFAALNALLSARDDALPEITWHGGVLRRWRGRLYAMAQCDAMTPFAQHWTMQKPLHLPALGVSLHAQTVRGAGVRAGCVQHGVWVCTRHATTLPRGASRASLGKRFQGLDIPPWRRAMMPLIYQQAQLLQIGDVWLEPSARATPDELGIRIEVRGLSPDCHNHPRD